MTDPTIICPNCQKEIKLNESLAAPLIEATRKEFEKRLAEQSAAMSAREAALKAERDAIAKQKAQIDDEVAEKLTAERRRIAEEEAKKARRAAADDLDVKAKELEEIKQLLESNNAKLAEARKQETEFRRKQRELEDKQNELDLELEKRLAAALAPEREKAMKAADEEYRLKLAEEQEKSRKLLEQLAEAKRRAEQGSQQMQGEIQELDLETRLTEAFPRDVIEPVPKGQFGGDVVQRVLSPQGQECGAILWESKRTKNWSGGWTDKLKQDQRAAKADVAVIVSQALPSGVDAFTEVDGVWVSAYPFAIPLAGVLRMALTEASLARRAAEGQQDKMAVLYQYMTGPQFRQRVEAIKDAFVTMQSDLDAERRVITKQWEKRQKQIERVMVSTVGMYGDLQAIAGTTIQEIEGLEMKALSSNIDCN
ncbi:MAG TPA: DUF2130 domain-containing protein [Phycisphaerae bacterium]|nr:DUF2130 domain-containing protein [Phycisphaerae bacterium]HRW53145.1 DUF2130 domain-containing protein [Phycisphaerae bacterium]